MPISASGLVGLAAVRVVAMKFVVLAKIIDVVVAIVFMIITFLATISNDLYLGHFVSTLCVC